MAEVRSGSFYTTGYSDSEGFVDQYIFSWSLSSQSIENNTSTISWSLKGADGKGFTSVKEKYVTVNGTTQSNSTWQDTWTGTVAFSGTSVIKHNADGTGSFSASAGGAFYYSGSYNSTGSGTWSLPTIPRATTPTFSATTVTMGSSVTITMTPASSGFKHKLRYSFGNLTEQTSGLSIGANFTAAGTTTATFTPPTSLANQITNTTTGTCTIYCYTYNSSGTQIGGTVSKTITLNVPSYNLTGSVALTGNNLLSSTYVQGKSTVTATITAASSYGATITSYSSTVDGKTYSGQTFTSSVLSNGSKTVSVTITDSRKKTLTFSSAAITVYEYSVPYITSFNVERQSNGTSVTATLVGGVSSVNSKNAKTFKVTLNGVTNTLTSTSYTINGTTTFTNVPTDSTLTATATITDSYTSATKEAVLPTIAVTLDFYKDGKGIAMGKVAETSGLLDVAWDTRVGKNLTVDGTHSVTGNTTIGGTLSVTGTSNLNKAPTISDTDWKILILKRVNAAGATAIQFINNTGSLGFIGMTGSELNTPLRRWSSDGATQYTVLDTGFTKDHVVEQAVSGVWTYRKWNSGFAECWGYHTISGVNISTAWGGWYASSVITLPSFPFTFSGAPDVHVGWESDFSAIIDGVGKRESTKAGQVYLYRPVAQTGVNGRFSIYAYGKWK